MARRSSLRPRDAIFAGLVALLFARVASGDERAPSAETGSIGEIVFECSTVNFAWGHRHSGFYVDRDGGVYRYDRSGEPWDGGAAPDAIPEAELRAKFTGRERVGDVGRDTVADKGRLLRRAAAGTLKRTHEAYDAGAHGCVGYLFDPGSRTYRTIDLGSDGDFRVTNSAREARALRRWLEGLAPRVTPAPDQTSAPRTRRGAATSRLSMTTSAQPIGSHVSR